jgi:hypothetical protein
MRSLLVVGALALCACSPSIKGEFLSSEHFVKVYEENGQVLADLHRSGFRDKKKPDATVSLTKDGEIYRAQQGGFFGAAGMTMSASKNELTLVLGGEKSTLKRIDPDDAREKLDTDKAVSAARSALLETVKFENKHTPCGELDSRRRAAFKQALEGAKLDGVKSTRQEAGLAWDRYEVQATLKLPGVNLTLPDQDVCTKQDRDLFLRGCVAWAKQDFKVATQAVALPLVAHVDQSKFPEADPREPKTAVVKLGDTELPAGMFGQQRQLEELLCKRVLVGPQQMAFAEQLYFQSFTNGGECGLLKEDGDDDVELADAGRLDFEVRVTVLVDERPGLRCHDPPAAARYSTSS